MFPYGAKLNVIWDWGTGMEEDASEDKSRRARSRVSEALWSTEKTKRITNVGASCNTDEGLDQGQASSKNQQTLLFPRS